jgi:hypothetical protein
MASATFNPSAKGAEALEKAKEAGAAAFDATKEAGAETFGKVKEAGAHVLDKAKEAAGSVGDMALETAAAVGHKADDLTGAAGHEIREFGETIGRKAPHEGIAGKASQAVADTIKGSGQYIEEHKLSGMANDVEQVIKNHPIPALLVCFGIGYCIGRAMKD